MNAINVRYPLINTLKHEEKFLGVIQHRSNKLLRFHLLMTYSQETEKWANSSKILVSMESYYNGKNQ